MFKGVVEVTVSLDHFSFKLHWRLLTYVAINSFLLFW